MRSVKWLLVGFAIVSLPLVGVGGVWAQDWCADEAKVREELETWKTYADRDMFEQCNRVAVPRLIATLKDESALIRGNAAVALGSIGAEAKDAVPALIDALKDPDFYVRSYAAEGLENIGTEDISDVLAIAELLKSENIHVRVDAAETLQRIIKKSETVLPALIEALKDKDSSVRESAVYALGSIGTEAKDAVPALIITLKDKDPSVRKSAAYVFESIGAEAKDAVPALMEALKDEDLDVRIGAAYTLYRIGAETKDAVPVLIEVLKNKNSDTRRSAVDVLGIIGGKSKDVIPALIATLEDQDSSVRRRAAYTLGSIGSGNKDAVPALINALKSKNSEIRWNATYALGNIGAEAKDAVPALIAALKDPSEDIRARAADALGNIGAEAKDAVPALIPTLKDKNSEVRSSAAYALRGMGTEAKNAIPALITTLKDKNPEVRSSAVYALRGMGTEAKNAIPALITTLKDKNPEVRSSAAKALGYISTETNDAVPALIEALKDPNDDVRKSAFEAVARIGAEAKDAVPALIEALKSGDWRTPSDAAHTLGSIGAEAKDAVPALIEALKNGRLSNSRESPEALENIAAALYDSANNAEQLGQVEKVIITIQQALKDTDFEEHKQQVERLLSALKNKQAQIQRDRWLPIARNLWLSHLLIWALLIFAYPKSPKVQTLFFWNPWVRRIMGLWYIGLLLAWVPFLRAKLFAPFKETLLAEAELDRFDTQVYFAGSTVLLKAVEQTQPLQEAIPKIKGQIVLEGESGLGKSMFLRSLARSSDRILVYLNASRCTGGVMEAIQAKLHGPAKDPKFLRDLIYSGAIDICIDGLNEVSADTRAKITGFVESYFKGNIIMTTQPLEWTPPATAKTYILQPLKRSQIEAFLISRGTSEAASASDYEDACSAYLLGALDSQRPSEVLRSVQRILSNPMDLTLVAQMLAAGEKPDLLSLQQQQYELMAAEYKQKCMKPFPLTEFSERVYQLRLDDETSLAESVFPEELRCMGRFKMVLSRQCPDGEGNPVTHWYFRHDKIMEFFIVQTFLGKDNPRVIDHIDDPRFRGVYFLLANLMPLEAAMGLREELILYAAQTQDHNVSDPFVQLCHERTRAAAATALAGA